MMLNNQTIIMLKFKKRKKNVFVDLDTFFFKRNNNNNNFYVKYNNN